jgi:hypothetical protein
MVNVSSIVDKRYNAPITSTRLEKITFFYRLSHEMLEKKHRAKLSFLLLLLQRTSKPAKKENLLIELYFPKCLLNFFFVPSSVFFFCSFFPFSIHFFFVVASLLFHCSWLCFFPSIFFLVYFCF